MNALSNDAKGFVSAVVSQLEGEKKAGLATRVHTLLTRVSAQAKKEKNALVETSISLTHEEKVRVERMLEKLLGHRVAIDFTVNSEVIAGMRIRVADWIFDSSFPGQLTKMKEHLRL